MHRAYIYIVKDGSHMLNEPVDIENEITTNNLTLLIFRHFVNGASPQKLVDLYRLNPTVDEYLPDKFMRFYLENIYELDGEIFTTKDEEFIEEFVRLAINTERLEAVPFVILAFAPTVPTWAGDMLEWLKDQEFALLYFITTSSLMQGVVRELRGSAAMVALRERYAEYDVINTITDLIFEKTELPNFEKLMQLDDRQARRHIFRIGLAGLVTRSTPRDWLVDLHATFDIFPHPIVQQVITRYTALIDEMQTA